MASPQYPFYFAWVDESETTFGPQHEVVDEDVFSFSIKHDEGQHPTLEITIRNPRIGLLNPSRKVWAWFSTQKDTDTVEPLFFGVLIGVPTNLFSELVTLKFIARSPTYIEDKQSVAESMKVRPYYDPVWISEKQRDEPDAILEGWSALWHVDRITLATTASDILLGEDGTIVFNEADAFYDSLNVAIGQPPLNNIRVEAGVSWTQRSTGYMAGPNMNVSSYTGGTLLSDWPKPGSSLGSGWRVAQSFVRDVYQIETTPTVTSSWHWDNTDTAPVNCSEKSSDQNASAPALLSGMAISGELTGNFVTGVCDPFADPPVNRPASIQSNGVIVPLWNVSASMTLRYDAKRTFKEDISFDVIAETQHILTSPSVSQNTELMNVPTVDVGKPLIVIDAWSDFAGQSVETGQIIFPNDPTKPGGLSYQICFEAGTAGDVEPDFSDIPGTITIDGTVHWASMGPSPLTSTPDWTEAGRVPVGEIMCFQEQVFDASMGEFVNTGQSSYYICVVGGETNSNWEVLTYVPLPTSNVISVQAPVNIAYIKRPTFTTAFGESIYDGSVEWFSLGQSPALLTLPIGGTPDNITARSYFPSDRGLWSVENLICKARARLRMRSRAVTVGWDCPFNLALGLSCRMNATIYDPRLPGGTATGKIIHYELKGDGDGKIIGHVEIGCPVGYDGHVSAEVGTPEYASDGYMQTGYQLYDGAQNALPENDIAYTKPVFAPFDDGLTFPLDLRQVSEGPSGTSSSVSLDEQASAIRAAILISQELANLGSPSTPDAAWAIEQIQMRLTARALPYVMEATPISWTCYLKPVTNGPFNGSYAIDVTTLQVPKGIDLEAPSSP